MKTKILSPLRRDGYKAGMIMMLIALSTMLLTTALVNNTAVESTASTKGYPFPVTVNVSRQGDEGTRASYNGETKKLSFSTGDKLFVRGDHNDAGMFAGMLDYDAGSGKFSGTIYTKNSYEGTADELFTDATTDKWVEATLLPAGYEGHGYLVINTNDPDAQYEGFIDESYEYTLATSKADGVAQFSYEYSYNYNNGFALSPHNAILNFTITGLAASTSVNVSLKSMGYNITGTVTTDASGNATFAAGIMGGLNLQPFSLTVGGNPITLVSSDKLVAKGKIYNITVKTKKVSSISLNKTSASLLIGGTVELSVSNVSPSDALDKTVTWSSSNTSVATVNASGVVTAEAAGSATITATANDGSGKTATCSVTVYPEGTIVWDSSNCSSLYIHGGDSYSDNTTIAGINLKCNAEDVRACWYSDGGGIEFFDYATGGYTFTAPTGKTFTKIEMIAKESNDWDSAIYNGSLGDGWPLGDAMAFQSSKKITWTGNASTVDLLTGANNFYGSPITSIAFFVSE